MFFFVFKVEARTCLFLSSLEQEFVRAHSVKYLYCSEFLSCSSILFRVVIFRVINFYSFLYLFMSMTV